MPGFAEFARAAARLKPRTAVVLGSGLAGATAAFTERASVAFADVPGLVPPTVHGHGGRLAVGEWAGAAVLLFAGRVHFYEGHRWETVVGTVRAAAELGARQLVLTNAAGGIHEKLVPGELMALAGHLKLLNGGAWRAVAAGGAVARPYSARLLDVALAHERAAGRELVSGVYAALTGPSYETPAEIRALAACGADAVGMSTAVEAEEAVRLGLEVIALSCVTNRAAGLSGAPLDHAEVLVNAQLAVARVGELLTILTRAG
jgi:purine-nucleoside phosphorylase